MSENIYCWQVDVNKVGDEVVYDRLFFVAANFFQLSHSVAQYVYGNQEVEGKYPNLQVEITSMSKVKGVGNIVNASFDDEDYEDGEEIVDPFDLSNAHEDDLIQFKHTCDEKITVTNSEWEEIECPKCKQKIDREEVQESGMGNMWVFIPNQKRKNGKRK